MSDRRYLEGAIAALDKMGVFLIANPKFYADMRRLDDGYRAQIAALPPDPSPYCQTCGVTLDGYVSPEPKRSGTIKVTLTDGGKGMPLEDDDDQLPPILPEYLRAMGNDELREFIAECERLKASLSSPEPVDWAALVEECEKALIESHGAIKALREHGSFGFNEEWADSMIGMHVDDCSVLAKIRAAKGVR